MVGQVPTIVIKIIHLRKEKKNYVQKLDLLQQPKINKFMFGFKEVIGKKK